jgi:hypothetical protein
MHRIRRLATRSPGFWRALVTLSWITTGLLLVAATFAIRLPSRVWLPDASKYFLDKSFMFSVPVKSQVVLTKYGRAYAYTSSPQAVAHRKEPLGHATTILAFSSNPLLKASRCPNIANIEPHHSSDCVRQGTLHGAPVYTIHRRMASMGSESYVTVGNTFLYIRQADRSSQNYLDTFVESPPGSLYTYLKTNSTRADRINAKVRADKKAQDHKDTEAYKLLDFTPALPQTLPAGWRLNTTGGRAAIEVDGPDAQHPSLINMDYVNNQKQYITFRSGRLSDYTLGTTCGPTPGASMEHLRCRKLGSYYEAVEENTQLTTFVRRLYHPVGDSLVITQLVVHGKGVQPAWPTELAQAQDAITLSAKPVSKDALKGAVFHQIFFYKK